MNASPAPTPNGARHGSAIRVLLVCQDRMGALMAGPAIRCTQFARRLAAEGMDVTLVLAQMPDPGFVLDGVRLHLCTRDAPLTPGMLHTLANRNDVVITQPLRIDMERALARARARRVYDLYVPTFVEELSQQALATGASIEARQLVYRKHQLQTSAALVSGDAFLCASEDQRHFWLGALGALGRLDAQTFLDDPSYRSVLAAVPFGIADEPAVHRTQRLRGVVDGIGPDDVVLTWAGGMWDWLDPLTPIRAMAAATKAHPSLRLCFLGTGHPSPLFGGMDMPARARALSDELGLTDRCVFFLSEWTPYDERAEYLLESDGGLCAHLDSVETQLSFRTRLLDHIWAGLPTLTTEGGALADLVARERIGVTLPAGDVNAWERELIRFALDAQSRDEMAERIPPVRERLTWLRVTDELVRVVRRLSHQRGTSGRSMRAMLGEYAFVSARVNRRLFGARGLLRTPGSLLR